MSQENYFWSEHEDEPELARLALLESVYDPATVRQLQALGVAEGWNCLEIGAGGGSIARWLAQKVGPLGKVVATDLDTRFLTRLNTPQLEVRTHNILTDELETDSYDLIHARWVLMHLREPGRALKKMADALRPGGWLFIEDADFASGFGVNLTDPSLDLIVTTWKKLCSLLATHGPFNPYFGRKERALVEQLGFADVGHEGWTQVFRGGEPLAQFNFYNNQQTKPLYLSAGILNEEQFESFQSQLLDPSVTFMDVTVFGAWGRKPT